MKDGQNSVRKVLDTTGSVVASYDYDAWGNVLGQTQPSGWIFNHRAFGEIYDPNLEMTYLRARWMDPSSGRFESRDPWAGDRTRPRSLHRFLYADSDPVNRADPSGRQGLDVQQQLTLSQALGTTVNGLMAAVEQKLPGGGQVVQTLSVCWLKFLYHYLRGNGATVDLQDWGLLDRYKQHMDVVAVADDVRMLVRKEVIRQASAKCQGKTCGMEGGSVTVDSGPRSPDMYGSDWFKKGWDACLWPMGGGTLKVHANAAYAADCETGEMKYESTYKFALFDTIKDGMDWHHLVAGNQDWRQGKTYDIRSGWTTTESLGWERFR